MALSFCQFERSRKQKNKVNGSRVVACKHQLLYIRKYYTIIIDTCIIHILCVKQQEL